MSESLTKVEISGKGWMTKLTVGEHMVPFDRAELVIDALNEPPRLTVSLPLFDGNLITLDAKVGYGSETRAALIAAGWTPPQEGDAVLVQVQCPACGKHCAAPAGVLPAHNSPSESPCGASGWTMRGTR